MMTIIEVKKENKQFPFSRIEKTEVHLKETGNNHLRYLSNSRSLGMIRLVSGMTFANNPLNMMASLSNIVAIAFYDRCIRIDFFNHVEYGS